MSFCCKKFLGPLSCAESHVTFAVINFASLCLLLTYPWIYSSISQDKEPNSSHPPLQTVGSNRWDGIVLLNLNSLSLNFFLNPPQLCPQMCPHPYPPVPLLNLSLTSGGQATNSHPALASVVRVPNDSDLMHLGNENGGPRLRGGGENQLRS